MPEPQQIQSAIKSLALSESAPRSVLPWWLPVIVIIGAFLLILGAIVALVQPAMLVGAGEEINGAVRVYAGYLVSRNLAIAAMLLGTLAVRARAALSHVMVLTAAVQIFDAGIDCFERRWTLVPGIIVLGILFFVGAGRTLGKPLWKVDSWRDPR